MFADIGIGRFFVFGVVDEPTNDDLQSAHTQHTHTHIHELNHNYSS
eukprot:COSAG02_NODE_12411_length_1550_cov_1.537560_3_plen_45_part_01